MYAISLVRAQFWCPRIASESHFERYFTCSRSVWVAPNSFGNAFCMLFHVFAPSLGANRFPGASWARFRLPGASWVRFLVRKRIFDAICVVPARFGLLWMASEVHFRKASEAHFGCYLCSSRSVWVALDGFGNAILTLFA